MKNAMGYKNGNIVSITTKTSLMVWIVKHILIIHHLKNLTWTYISCCWTCVDSFSSVYTSVGILCPYMDTPLSHAHTASPHKCFWFPLCNVIKTHTLDICPAYNYWHWKLKQPEYPALLIQIVPNYTSADCAGRKCLTLLLLKASYHPYIAFDVAASVHCLFIKLFASTKHR